MRLKVDTNLTAIEENNTLNKWAEIFSRHPQQLNNIHEADSELLQLSFTADQQIIAATIDTISEEIDLKFYQEPETMGWVAVMASLSDLAAVGAQPFGILVSVTLAKMDQLPLAQLQCGIAKGMETACRRCETFVLGGDTNFSTKTSISVCALGGVARHKKLTRKGATAGDLIYSTGLLGDGAALAAKKIYSLPDALYLESAYRPIARLKEGAMIANFATSCMDTSDGLISTLDQIARINGVGINISVPAETLISHAALKLIKALSLPPFPFLASQHGEFELVFTIHPAEKHQFEDYAAEQQFKPILIGELTKQKDFCFNSNNINATKIRNLYTEVNGDLKRYLEELILLQ